MKRIILILGVLIVALRFVPLFGHSASSAPAAPAVQDADTWTCAMHPNLAASEPGDCPICGMALVKRERGGSGPSASGEAAAHIEYTAPQERAADIKTAKVVRGYPRVSVRLFGRVADAAGSSGGASVDFAAFPADLPFLRFGQRVAISSSGLPGASLHGKVARIGERIDTRTNTAAIDVRVANADGRLRPGLAVSGVVKVALAGHSEVIASELRGKWLCPDDPDVVGDGPGRCPRSHTELQPAESFGYVTSFEAGAVPLLIPETAALVLGQRAIVYVRDPDRPVFSARTVVLGPRAEGVYTVQSGVSEGETVVVNGAVRIDSDLQIRGLPSLLSSVERPRGMSAPAAAGQTQRLIR